MTSPLDLPVRPFVEGTDQEATTAGVPAELADNDTLPWFHLIDGMAAPEEHSQAWALNQYWSTGFCLNGISYFVGTVGSYFGIDLYIAAGTWTIMWPLDTRGDYPIVKTSYSRDGSTFTDIGSTFDRYAATQGYTVYSVPGIVLPRGYIRFRQTITGKNPSSSGYTLVYSGIMLTRTA